MEDTTTPSAAPADDRLPHVRCARGFIAWAVVETVNHGKG